jgi:ABC-2 type transport system permease protein
MVLLFPGAVTPVANSGYTFEPIVRSGRVSGSLSYAQYVQRSFFGSQLTVGNQPHFANASDYPMAARIYGESAVADTTATAKKLDVIVVADVDFISDQFFQIRNSGIENLNFDNISFFLNCIDLLAGDNSFVELRKRRVRHRTLATVESRVRAYSERRAQEQQQAESEAQAALNDAQRRLNEKVAEVQQRSDLDSQTKQIMARNLQEVENRRFETLKANINAERDTKIQRSKEDMESQIRAIHSNIKTLAGLGPPIPVFVLGIIVFMRRRKREREGAAAAHRLKG